MATEVQPQHGTHRLGILHGARYATLQDLELALEAALSVNQHLNQEIESVLQRLKQVEQERDAWQQRAGQLAKQLQSERVQRHTEGGADTQGLPAASRGASAAGGQRSAAGAAAGADVGNGNTAVAAADAGAGLPGAAAAADPLSMDPASSTPLAAAAGGAEVPSIPNAGPWPEVEPAMVELAAKGRAAGWLASTADVQLGPVLGSGAFGTTHRATWRGADVAVKCVRVSSATELTNFLREVEVLAGLRHPHVVPFLGAVLQDVNTCWLISEYMPRGTLAEWLHSHSGPLGPSLPLTERLARALEVASALAALESHRPQLLHRDVKPSNIFLDGSGAARLGDWGLARALPTQRATLTGETGTYLYMSPEMTRHEIYDNKTDVWSFGVMLAELVTGVTPYADTYMTPVQIAMAVADEQLAPWVPDSAPAGVQALVAACCDFDPEMRPGFELVVAELGGVIQEIKQQQKESGGGGLLGRLISSGGLPMSWTHVLAPLANGNTAAS